nr:cell division control protein 6 homolog [Procambarus clarkii]
MPGKQEVIEFPIRKTRSLKSDKIISTETCLNVRSSRAKSRLVKNSTKSPNKTDKFSRLEDVSSSHRKSTQNAEISSAHTNEFGSPRRSSRKKSTLCVSTDNCNSPKRSLFGTVSEAAIICKSPERQHGPRRECSPNQGDTSCSQKGVSNRAAVPTGHNEQVEVEKGLVTPSKRTSLPLSEWENELNSPKRMIVLLHQLPLDSTNITPSKACRKLMPDILTEENSNSHFSTKDTKRELSSPVRFSSLDRSSTTADNRITKLQTPQKSSLSASTSNIAKCDSPSNISRVIFKSPSRPTVKCLNMNSPVKSPLKRLDVNFSLRSPLKRLDDSPRRSPRKFNQENIFSPRRSPRKLALSPTKVNSPSSLVSKLSLTSPSRNMKDIAVGLFKPDVTAYRAVRQCLNTGTPTVLVCREKQIGEMEDFLSHHLKNALPGSLYVSGAPGTGKTASLNSIINSLEVTKIKKIFLNCMTLKTSGAIYKTIVSGLGLKLCGTERENMRTIEKAITSSKCPILIMLDEVDQLDSKNQEVLYTIFEWPALAGSTLVLVGIANSLDLTDRILPRLQSRPTFKPKLLHFPPYTKAEIIKIINQRIEEAGLGNMQVIRQSAIQFLAMKVASVAGDVRKALDVCRRAVELCEIQARRQSVLKPSNGSPRKSPRKQENAPLKMVEIPQVMSIFNEVYGSRVITAVTDAPDSFPLQQKVLICSLLLILKHGKTKGVTLGKFHEVYTRVCKKRQMPNMDQTEFLSVCVLLESRGMLQVKRAKEIRSSKVALRLNAEEAERTLGDRSLLASVLEDKESLGKLCKV